MRIEGMSPMEKYTVIVVAALVAVVLRHHHHLEAAAAPDVSTINAMAVDTSHRQIMQVARARFGLEIPRMFGAQFTSILYNDDEHRYGPYYVELDGISVAGRRLPGISADMFRRNETTGEGGTVLDVREGAVLMVPAAYNVLERAVRQYLRPLRLPRVRRAGFAFCCLNGAKRTLWKRIPTVMLHLGDWAVVNLPPTKLFVLHGEDVCLNVLPANRTVIGAVAQVNMRFTVEVEQSTVYLRQENCELDT